MLHYSYGLTCPDGAVDMRDWDPCNVVGYFDALTASGEVLLHGSNDRSSTGFLDPRPAFDLYRESGCKTAIYATENVPQSLYFAVYNKKLARLKAAASHGGIEVSSCKALDSRRCGFLFTPKVFEEIAQEEDTPLVVEGYIYALRKSTQPFERDPTAPLDWFSEVPVYPAQMYKVSRGVGQLLFGNQFWRFTARAYTAEELEERRTILETAGRLLYPHSS